MQVGLFRNSKSNIEVKLEVVYYDVARSVYCDSRLDGGGMA